MQFAINYSTQAAVLLSGGLIPIDRFKCPDWPDLVAEAMARRPVAVHFSLQAGGNRLAGTDWDKIDRLMSQTGTPYVNLHIEPKQKDFPDYPIITQDNVHVAHILKHLIADVSLFVQHFGAENIIIENVPYRGHPGGTFRMAVVPETLKAIVEVTGCGLLLDISHARISAHYLGMDAYQYLNELPVENLTELHFTGIHHINGGLLDHLSVLDSDWPVLDWVLEKIKAGVWPRPWLLSYEYGGVGTKFSWRSDAQVIQGDVPRLYQLIKTI